MISIRKAVTITHRWTGLTIGLFAVVMAVTGAGLALRPMLDRVLYRGIEVAPACAAPWPLDDLVAVARAAHPQGQIAYTRIDPGSGGSTMVRFADNDSVYVDPCSGVVLGQQNRYAGLFGRIEQLHRLAYWKNALPNKLIKGGTAISLALASIVGGLVIWWPRRASAWKRAATLNPRLRGRAFVLNLHAVTGVYIGLIVFVVAMTGVPLAFDWARQGLYAITRSSPPVTKFATPVPPVGASVISFETARRQLEALVPAPATAVFHYPRKPGDAVEIYAVAQDAPHGEARSYLYLDAQSGLVLSFQPYDKSSNGRKLYAWILAIHTGRAGGWIVDILLFAGMLGVPLMAYTGIESYVRKKLRPKVGAASPSTVTPDPSPLEGRPPHAHS